MAWVWIDDELLQNLLVTNGLAETYMLQNNYKYAGILQESEEVAKNNKVGIWSSEISEIQNNENKINEDTVVYKEERYLEYMFIIIGVILIRRIISIAHKKKKRK